MRRWLSVLTTTAMLTACSAYDGDGASGPTVLRTKQEPLKPDAWQKELDAAPDLAALVPPGQALQAAGVIEDSAGQRVVWGEYANTAESPVPISGEVPREQVQAIVRSCSKAKVCKSTSAAYTAQGATLETQALGAPALAFDLKNHNYTTDPQTVQAPLTAVAGDEPIDRDAAQAAMAAVQWQQRRCVVLNAFGPSVNVSAQAIVAAAEKSGLFQSVTLIDFARRSDLLAIAPTLSARDVLVWVGATVRDTKQGETVPVGLTLSRGVIGDEMIHAKQITQLLRAPVLGGPGLLVLAGSGSLAPATQKDALSTLLADRNLRPVVGFSGKVGAQDAVAAVASLVGALGGGQTLAAALSAGGHGLATTLDAKSAGTWKLPAKDDALWTKKPVAAQLSIMVEVDPACHKMSKNASCDPSLVKNTATITAPDIVNGTLHLDCEAQIDGAWISCEGQNEPLGQKFTLKGVFTGTGIGDHLVFYADGDGSHAYQALTLLGDAVIAGQDKGGGTTTLELGGTKTVSYAAMSPFLDEAGRCCQAVNPFLHGLQGEACKLVLKF